jgi:glycosyltransferase involved in cell wall biosynthesis
MSVYGIEHVPHLPLRARTLASHGVHVAHLHWGEWAWQSRGRFEWRRRNGVKALGRFIADAERRGIVVIWTVHNLAPHENSRRSDEDGFALLHHRATLRIFHSRHARDEALERYGARGDTIVMPHGNYVGAFPAPRSRELVRGDLGLRPETRLLLCAGNVRAYKGTEVAIMAMQELTRLGYQLLIAGRAEGRALAEIKRAVRGIEGVRLEAGRMDAQRLADLHEAADAVLLPYSDVTGSGALLAALSQSRAVIVTPLPYFKEILAPEPDAGVIVAGGSSDALVKAVELCFASNMKARNEAARRLADLYAWERVVPPVAEWLHSHLGKPA